MLCNTTIKNVEWNVRFIVFFVVFFHFESSWKQKSMNVSAFRNEFLLAWGSKTCGRIAYMLIYTVQQRENSLHTNVLLIFHYKIIYISISILEKAFILAPLYGKLKMKPDVHETLKVRQDKNLYSAPDVIIVQLFHKPNRHSIAHCSGQVSRSSCLNI